jgi:hypothetical protein
VTQDLAGCLGECADATQDAGEACKDAAESCREECQTGSASRAFLSPSDSLLD